MTEIEQVAFAGFSAQERDQLRALLARIRANLDTTTTPMDVDAALTKERGSVD